MSPTETLQQRAQRILERGAEVFVREQFDGRWGSYALSELPPDVAVKHALRLASDEYLQRQGRAMASAKLVDLARPFVLQTNVGSAFILISQLQLALRHPGNTGPGADVARKTVMDMIGAMPEGARELLLMGFDPAWDVKL